jgi:hypothetical protein
MNSNAMVATVLVVVAAAIQLVLVVSVQIALL